LEEFGFVWIEDLDRLLQQYEQQRSTFAQFDNFAPLIAKFFGDVGESIQDPVKELDNRRPRIVSVTPRDGETGVDPSTTRIVVVCSTDGQSVLDQLWARRQAQLPGGHEGRLRTRSHNVHHGSAAAAFYAV
jgi:hypothetical protein